MHQPLLVLASLAALPVFACAQDDIIPTVTITASKEAVVRKVDQTVVDVSSMARAQNGTAQDVLQAMPELSVAADGRMAVKGNTNVTVLIDGKPSAMLAGDERAVALQTMNGADIASVEVMSNPSAAYSANGGAIVNLVLKRHRQPGAHAQLRASAADQGLWNAAASGDATSGKLSVNGSVAYRRDGTQKYRAASVDWSNPQDGQTAQTAQTKQTSAVFVRRIVRSAGLGLDYALSATDSLNLSAHHHQRRSRPWLDVLNENLAAAERTIFHRLSSGPNQQTDHDASFAYTHQGQGSVLKAALTRSSIHSLIDKSYRDVYLEPVPATDDNGSTSRGVSRGISRFARRLDQATLDWTRASDLGQWGVGIDVQDQVDALANYQASVDRTTGAETPDPATTNGYSVASRLTAAYLTDKLRRGRWEVLLGGRFEQMALRIVPVQGSTPIGRWRAFNPSLHSIYALSDKTDLTFGYRRSLQRPDPRDLNPFTTYVDAQNLSRGNPDLQPQRLAAWELGLNAKSGSVSASLGAFHRISRDTVVDARRFTVDQVLVTSRQNGGESRATGLTAALDWTPATAPRLNLGLDGGVGRYRMRLDPPDLGGPGRQHDVAGYLNLRASWKTGPHDLSLDAHWQSASITPLGRYGATSSVNATWKRELTSTISLTVNANDIFDGSRRTYHTFNTDNLGSTSNSSGIPPYTVRQSGFDHFVARRWYVGLVKKFG